MPHSVFPRGIVPVRGAKNMLQVVVFNVGLHATSSQLEKLLKSNGIAYKKARKTPAISHGILSFEVGSNAFALLGANARWSVLGQAQASTRDVSSVAKRSRRRRDTTRLTGLLLLDPSPCPAEDGGAALVSHGEDIEVEGPPGRRDDEARAAAEQPQARRGRTRRGERVETTLQGKRALSR